MVSTWSDSDPSSSDSELEMEIKENLCLMAIDDEVCLDELDDFDKLQMSMNANLMILKKLGIDAKIKRKSSLY